MAVIGVFQSWEEYQDYILMGILRIKTGILLGELYLSYESQKENI